MLKMIVSMVVLLVTQALVAAPPARVQGVYDRDVVRVEGLNEVAGEHADGIAILYEEIDAAIDYGNLTEAQEAAFESARVEVDAASGALNDAFTSLGVVDQNLTALFNASDIRSFGTAHGPFNSWCNFTTTRIIDVAQLSEDAYKSIGDAYYAE